MMNSFKKSEDRQQRVQNVFKQLLERLSKKNTNKKRPTRNTIIFNQTTNKQRRLTTNPQNSYYSSPHKTIYTQSTAFKVTPFHHKKIFVINKRNVSIKGSLSNRSNTQLQGQHKQFYSKIQKYNQLLITKSYIFGQFQRKNNKLQELPHFKPVCNFESTHKNNLRSFKNNYIQKKISPLNKTQGIPHRQPFQPWETQYNDLY